MASGVENSAVGKAIATYVKDPEYTGLLTRLYKCWNEIGYSSETLRNLEKGTISAVLQPFKDNIRDCVVGEEAQLQQYRDTVRECFARVAKISTELSLTPYHLDPNLALIEQARVLTEKADALFAKRQERMEILGDLIQKNVGFCRVLDQPLYEIDPEIVPSHDQLTAFSTCNAKLQQDRDVRLRRLHEVKKEVQTLMAELEKKPTNDLQLCLFVRPESEFSLTDSSFDSIRELKEELFAEKLELTEEILQLRSKCQAIRHRLKLENDASRSLDEKTQKISPTSRNLLRTELERLEVLKVQNMKNFIMELRKDIMALHEKCFIGSAERNTFPEMTSQVYDENCLEMHEAEAARLQEFYNQNADFFTKIVRREEVWKKKMEVDEKESDPNRFNNRGGQLLRDQQEKAKVEHELKRLDTDLAQKIQQWVAERGTPFYVYGRSYADFVQEQKTAYEAQLSRLKDERKKAKEGGAGGGGGGVGGAAVAGKRKVDAPTGKVSVQKTVGVAGMMQRSPKMQRTGGPHHDC